MPISLVTGGAGFIGSHLVKDLLNSKHTVVVLDDLSGGFVDQVDPRAIFIKGSICDHILIDQIFTDYKFDYVYHLAAYAAEGLSHFIRRYNYMNNLIGSVNLINASVKYDIKCFVFTSSIAVYGSLTPPMKEDINPSPEDPYGIAKLAVELDLYAANHMFGLNYIIFRPHNVYGECQNIGDRYRNVVGIFMNQIMQNIPLSIFGDGTQKRAFTYVGDISSTIARSVMTPRAYGEIFNIGSSTPHTVNELSTLVMRSMGTDTKVEYLDSRNEVLFALSDHDKVDRIFGQQKETTLENGLDLMASWVKSVGPRKSKVFEEIEIYRKLPPSWEKN